ncbi:MAG: zinc ribbon domain-containing protein [Chloroflexota bacterium]
MSELRDKEPQAQLAISCPSCNSQIDVRGHQAEITCAVCNSVFVLAGHLCPSCGTYHQEDQATCQACGTPLVRLCRHCHTTNWTGDETCIECGERIDLLSQIEAGSRKSTPERLSQQMAAAKQLNLTEAQASDRRMAELMAIEEARLADLRRQRTRRQRQERTMLIVVFAAVLIFLVVLLGFALISAIT